MAFALGAGPSLAAAPFQLGKAPAFELKDLDGHVLRLDALRRRGPVLLDFWATWCKPCQAAIPELRALHASYAPRGLTIIGVSVDGPRNHSKVRPFVQSKGIGYPIVIDQDGRLQQLYQVIALPTSVLIDTSGMVVAARVGFRPGESRSLGEKIEALLAPDSLARSEP